MAKKMRVTVVLTAEQVAKIEKDAIKQATNKFVAKLGGKVKKTKATAVAPITVAPKAKRAAKPASTKKTKPSASKSTAIDAAKKAIVALAASGIGFSMGDAVKATGMSKATTRNALKALITSGDLCMHGEKRRACYAKTKAAAKAASDAIGGGNKRRPRSASKSSTAPRRGRAPARTVTREAIETDDIGGQAPSSERFVEPDADAAE